MSSTKPEFPAKQIPADGAYARLLGLYPQIQDGLWLQRIKILGGILTSQQWQALATITRRYTPNTPLHLTTRQDIEIHDLKAEDVPGVQGDLAAVGLTSVGAAGDTVRNVTVCPCSGLAHGTPDLAPLARQIRQMLETEDGVFSLPRKFKVSLSACARGCAQPYINDLGLVAVQRGNTWGFRVIVAGSLGVRPATGIELFDWLPAGDMLPLVLAAIRVFAQHGDRANRAKARLRHVRERIGNEAFVTLLKEAFARAKSQRSCPKVAPLQVATAYEGKVTLSFLGGDVTPEAAEALAKLASQPDIHLRISNHHRVIVFGKDKASLAAHMAATPDLVPAALPQPAIVACPGRRWCKRAVTGTLDLARRFRDQLADVIPADATICISGCPNGCAQSAVADIGLSGMLATENGVQHEAYNLVAGGGMGRSEQLATPIAQRLRADDIIRRIAAKSTTGDSGN